MLNAAASESLRAAVAALPAAVLETQLAPHTALLVSNDPAERTEKLACAAWMTPHIVSLAYVLRCAARRAWLPVEPRDVPALVSDRVADVDLAAALRARGARPRSPLADTYFALLPSFALENAGAAESVRRLVQTAGGRLERTVTVDFAALYPSLIVLSDRELPLDSRASRALAAMGVLYDYRIVVTAMVRGAVAAGDRAAYRISAR